MKYDPEKFIPFEEVEKIWNDNKSENRHIFIILFAKEEMEKIVNIVFIEEE